MFKFGKTSKENLSQVHPDLQTLCQAVLDRGIFDFGVTCGHRNEEEQNKAFFSGVSKAKWPDSKHNKMPSDAIDFVLYVNGKATFREQDKPGYYMAVGVFRAMANKLGIPIRCGADWDGDFDITDQTLHDLCHIELYRP